VRLPDRVDPGHHAGSSQRVPAAEAASGLSKFNTTALREHAVGYDNLVTAL
jgi:hypothetical protein